jgi:uncharacterized membrane protein YoaK (UPF0700 family)
VSGVTTTYVTGTLTSVMQDIAERKNRGQLLRVASIAALVVGAFAGAGAVALSPTLGPLLPWAAAIAAIILVAPTDRTSTAA